MPTTDSSNSSDEPDSSTARKARKRKSTFETEDIVIPSTSSEDTLMVVQEEMKLFVGLIGYMGIVKLPKLADYWSKSVKAVLASVACKSYGT
ncbi:Transposase IS4 [Popillia japonica]|uniref:Transposase IS4 n=1 Tax=Popillia japonica TaxID=7064 RepID=A0AAW1IV10_POPJA